MSKINTMKIRLLFIVTLLAGKACIIQMYNLRQIFS